MNENPMTELVKGTASARRISPLLRLLGFVPLLAVTMATGPCGQEPLGSVDGGRMCAYKGKTYGHGATFPSPDGCNVCTCDDDGVVRCTVSACPDGAVGDGAPFEAMRYCFDPITGEPAPCPDGGSSYDAGARTCFDVGGNVTECPDSGAYDGPVYEVGDNGTACQDSTGRIIPCATDAGPGTCAYLGKYFRPGDKFLAADGCNWCFCDTQVQCTTASCADAGIRDAGTTCNYAGMPYPVGSIVAAGDGCNKCTCGADGMFACTAVACRDGGAPADGGLITGVCTPEQDSTCNEDPFASTLRGKCRSDGSCLCNGAGTSGVVSPYTGKCLGIDNMTGNGCELYKTYPVGATFACGDSTCNVCRCEAPGKISTVSTCIDAGLSSCGLDAIYIYGDIGGLRVSQDQVTIGPSPTSPRDQATYVRTRNNVDGTGGISCNPPFPACGDMTALDVSDIMADIHDPVVQKYLTADPAKPPFLGFDTRPIDGTAFSFMRGDGHGFLVGQACGTSSSASSCVAIPPPVDKLVKDLRALDDQQLRSPGCAALR